MRRLEGLRRAVIVMEGEARRTHGKTLDRIDDMRPIRDAAELAIGDDGEAELLLHRHAIADGPILRRGKGVRIDRALGEGAESLTKLGRAQQAADMLGAEG